MWLNWGDIFYLVGQVTGLNQTEIADLLNVDASVISRVKKGTTQKFNYEVDALYKKLFDPKNEALPIYKNKETILLDYLRDAIEEIGLQEKVVHLWDEKEYKTFVIGMLRIVKNEPSTKGNPNVKGNPLMSPAVESAVVSDAGGYNFVFEVDYTNPHIRTNLFNQQYVGDAFMADHVTNATCEACAFSGSLETAMKMWHLKGRKADFNVEVIDKRTDELEKRISTIETKMAGNTDSQEDQKEYKTLNILLRHFNEETDIKRASIEFYLRNERLYIAFPPMQYTDFLAYAKRILEYSYHGWRSPSPDYGTPDKNGEIQYEYAPSFHIYRIYLSPKGINRRRSFEANIPLDILKQVPVKYWEHRKAGDVLEGGKVFIEAVNIWYYRYLAMQVRDGEDIDTDERVRHWVGGWAFDKTS